MSLVPDLSLDESSCQKRKVRRWSDPGRILMNTIILIITSVIAELLKI